MEVLCRHFNGYKPCGKAAVCDRSCKHRERLRGSILLIHLGAMGAVVRSTALLERIHAKYPHHQLTWVTDAPMHILLAGHPRIDRIVSADEAGLQEIRGRHFDVALVIDKSARAAGILSQVEAKKVYGFVRDERFGGILPATEAAEELWHLGLSNELKFFVNQKTETQLVAEALELAAPSENFTAEYDFHLTPAESTEAARRKSVWRRAEDSPVIAFNTGCGPLMPAKKWSVNFHREVIALLLKNGFTNLLLVGGPDDAVRNAQIAKDLPVIATPTSAGVRDGAVSIAAADIVLTGDSFGMHLAIALKKQVIAWFGPSCAHEIELYGRGTKLEAEVDCAPCWKRSCEKPVMCHDRVPADRILAAVVKAVANISPAMLTSGGDGHQDGQTHPHHPDGFSGRPAAGGDALP